MEDIFLKPPVKKFFLILWQVFLGLAATFAVFIFSLVLAALGALFVKWLDPLGYYALLVGGPVSSSGWLSVGFLTFCLILIPVGLGIFVARDAGKLKKNGIEVRPAWWGVGSALPSSVIILPFYFVLRSQVWANKLSQSDPAAVMLKKGWKWPWVILIIVVAPGIFNFIQTELERPGTEAAVVKIHTTKLTLDDVLGKNLPPEPGAEAAQATIAGIDENKNGIRDDVELAIFKEYPNSAKTRAVLLQYALALQMEMTQEIVNTETVTEAITELSRADTCLADQLVPRKSAESSRDYSDLEKIDLYVKFVEKIQFNTEPRLAARDSFYKKLGSFGESTNAVCDLDKATLPN
ncbi:MAG: hypothetical protein WCT25_04585 [Candidatus Paceibacterota bacterium]